MSGLYRLDDLRVDIARRRVLRGETELDVAGLSFDLLAYLLSQGDHVVSFDELIAAVWAPAVVGEDTVTQRVKLLRQALGDDGRNPRYLRSVRGRGYQLCQMPQPLAATPASAKPASTTMTAMPAATATAAKTSSLPGLRWVLLLVSLPLLSLAALMLLRQRDAAAPPANEREQRLQRARYYAGIGQQDDIERAIALYQSLLREDANDAAAQTGLSFAYSTRVCLYNQPPDGAAQAEQLALSVLARQPRDSLALAALAYSHDCRGHLAAAIAYYEQAVAADPAARRDSAASLAYLYMVKGRLAEALARHLDGLGAATKPRYLEIQLARNLELLGETAAAEQRYRRSFELYPDNVFSNAAWPRALLLQGRLAEAQQALDEALRRTRHPELYLLQGELALLRGDRPGAADAYTSAARLRPHASLPQTLALLQSEPPPAFDVLRQRLAQLPQEQSAEQGGWPEDEIERALLLQALDDKPAALQALQAAVDAGWRDRAWLQTSALFRPLAAEPRFAVLLDDIAARVARERAQAAQAIRAAAAAP